MPRVKAITPTQRKINDDYSRILGDMKLLGLRQTDIAKWLGLSQQSLSYRLKHKSLSHSEYVLIRDGLDDLKN